MSTIIAIPLKQGRDGRLYPAVLPRPRAELNRIRWLSHRLHCEQGLSERRVQRVLLEQHGIRRSAGIVHRDLADFECPACAGGPPEPEPAPPAELAAPRTAAGAGWAGPAPW